MMEVPRQMVSLLHSVVMITIHGLLKKEEAVRVLVDDL